TTWSPSTSNTAGSDTASPGSPASFSTSITSPSATLYCLPPVLTIAYIATRLPVNVTLVVRIGSMTGYAHPDSPAHSSAPWYRIRHAQSGRPPEGAPRHRGAPPAPRAC